MNMFGRSTRVACAGSILCLEASPEFMSRKTSNKVPQKSKTGISLLVLGHCLRDGRDRAGGLGH